MKDSTTYVGLDVHKKQHSVAILFPGGAEPVEMVIPNTAAGIARLARVIRKRTQGPVQCAYEAGCCGFAIQRQIEAQGLDCMVAATSLIPIRPGRRVHTNRRDARKLAEMLRGDLLTAVEAPTEAQEAVRDLCRVREAAHVDLGRARHRLVKFLLRRGLVYQEGGAWTQKHLSWVRSLQFDWAVDRRVLADLLAQVEHQSERLRGLDQELAGVGQEDPYRQPVGWLRCFRGIDTVTAVTLVAELFGIERFDSPRQLMSYLGLTPSEDSTGDKVRKGPITKAGNRRVRRLLVEASWHQTQLPRVGKALAARRREQPLWAITLADRAMRRLHRRYWHLVHKGKSPSKAVTAVARELVGFVWAGLRLQGGSVGGDPRRGRVRSGARSRRSGVAASPRAPLRGDPPDAEAVPAGPPARPRPGEEAKPAERLTPGQEMKAFFARGRKS